MKPMNMLSRSDMELSNFDDDQNFNHVMPPYIYRQTAYNGAPNKKNFRVELQQNWKVAVVQFFWSVVHHFLLL